MNPYTILDTILDVVQSAALIAAIAILWSAFQTLKTVLAQSQAANQEIIHRLHIVETLLDEDIAQSHATQPPNANPATPD